MKPAALFAMTYLSVTQLETRHRLVSAELRRERAAAEARRAKRPRSARGLFRAVRGAAAA
jgi:uncharacterized small protein (DUF1192 family)